MICGGVSRYKTGVIQVQNDDKNIFLKKIIFRSVLTGFDFKASIVISKYK